MAGKLQDSTIRIMMLSLIVVLIFYMILSFAGFNAFSVVNVKGESTVRSGEEQTYHISLRTVDPDQFKTELHYREQYGKWKIIDANGTVLSPGKETKIDDGVYDQFITITIPYGHKNIVLKTEIIEYQFSAVKPEGPFLKDAGTSRVEESLSINIIECAQHSDCNLAGTCLGQFGYCTANLCEVKGECKECVANSDCAKLEEATAGVEYQCADFKCKEFKQPTLIDNVKQTFSEPITEPGTVEAGKAPQPKQASPILAAGVLLMIAVVGYIGLKKGGKL